MFEILKKKAIEILREAFTPMNRCCEKCKWNEKNCPIREQGKEVVGCSATDKTVEDILYGYEK